MTSFKWFFLGMMVAWTPSLLFMALVLWRYKEDANGAIKATKPAVRCPPRDA